MKRLSKPSVAKDPKEKLIEDLMEHLGIAGAQFNRHSGFRVGIGDKFRDISQNSKYV